jgi:hypothetical protein
VTASPRTPFSAEHSGVYRTPQDMNLLRQAAARVGIAFFVVDIARAKDKEDFLAACATALEFPRGFGGNWDAFADCVQDLSWHAARGYVIHLQDAAGFARAAPQDYATAIEILRYAADYWRERGTGFLALVDDALELPAFAP